MLLGGGIVVLTGTTSTFDPTGYRTLSMPAVAVGAALMICAWFSLFHLRWADWAGVALLAVAASLWLAHGTAWGALVGGLNLLLGATGVVLGHRAMRARRRALAEGSTGRTAISSQSVRL
jgi:hypothetical protein